MDVTVGEYKNFIQDLKAGWTEALAGFFDDLSRQYLTKQQQWERTARLFYERADDARYLADYRSVQARVTGDASKAQFWSDRANALTEWAARRDYMGSRAWAESVHSEAASRVAGKVGYVSTAIDIGEMIDAAVGHRS